jgi:hypothetical protein
VTYQAPDGDEERAVIEPYFATAGDVKMNNNS